MPDPTERSPQTVKLDRYLKTHPNPCNAELYAAFPDMPKPFIRKKKAYFFARHPTQVEESGESQKKRKRKVEEKKPKPQIDYLKDFGTESLSSEIRRIYNSPETTDEDRRMMLKQNVIPIWRYQHNVPVEEKEQESLGDILSELQKSRKPTQQSVQ